MSCNSLTCNIKGWRFIFHPFFSHKHRRENSPENHQIFFFFLLTCLSGLPWYSAPTCGWNDLSNNQLPRESSLKHKCQTCIHHSFSKEVRILSLSYVIVILLSLWNVGLTKLAISLSPLYLHYIFFPVSWHFRDSSKLYNNWENNWHINQ